jgi:endonuclease/exonuclease/phosphatase family metal-dependent hydrolase
MRIVSYNILDGGEGRADPLAEVLQAQRADVIALVEASFGPVVERIAARLDMDYVVAEGNKDSAASALLSRWPIRDSVNHAALRPGLTKSLLEATVVTPEFGELPVGVVHLHAHAAEADERAREAELAAVLEVFAAARRERRPHVLCGDFNANAPSQRIDPAKVKESTRREWEQNGGQLPRRIVQALLDAGYVDALHVLKGPEAETTGTFSTQHPGQRVDYIFTFGIGRPRLRDAWIEQDRLAKYASDHFPIGAEVG